MSKIDKSYHNLLEKILEEGYDYNDESRDTICKQISSYEFRHNLQTDGFPAISTKKLYWKGVIGELIWFLRGDTNIKYLVDNNIFIWNKDAYNYYLKETSQEKSDETYDEFFKGIQIENHKAGELGPVYGSQWRSWTIGNNEREIGFLQGTENGEGLSTNDKDFIAEKKDQFSDLIQNLKDKPMSRRHIIIAWNPAELDEMALPPCHWSFEIIPRPLSENERIEIFKLKYKVFNGLPPFSVLLDDKDIPRYSFDLKWHQRSVDTFLGLPFNIASYATLTHIIGKLTNMIPNELIGDLSNVHIYEPHIDAVKEQLSRDVNKYNNCNLEIIDIPEFDRFLKDRCSINNLFSNFEIENFKLQNYESYPTIAVEMIAPK